MGAALLAPLFTSSVAHPQRAVGFALYVPRVVWEGVDLFTDPYRWGWGWGLGWGCGLMWAIWLCAS